MEINLECSAIFNDEFSQFMDNNSQICIHEEEDAQQHDGILTQAALAQADQENGLMEEILPEILSISKEEQKIVELSEIEAIIDQSAVEVETSQHDIQEKSSSQQYGGAQPLVHQLKVVSKAWAPIKKNKDEPFKLKPEFRVKVIGARPPIIPALPIAIQTLEPQATEAFRVSAGFTSPSALTLTQGSSNGDKQLISTSTSTLPSNKQWQKVSIAKRRPITATQQDGGQRSTSTSVIAKPKEPINISDVQNNEDNYPRTYREKLISSPSMNQDIRSNRKRKEGEIVPLFDCLFCCQEHFVLDKLSENTLCAKYGQKSAFSQGQQDTLMVNYIERGYPPFDNLLKQNLQEEVVAVTEIAKIKDLKDSVNFFSNHFQPQTFQTPILKHHLSQLKPKLPQKQEVHFLPLAELSQSGSLLQDSRMQLKSRRQRIMENISFETECHNIYDPYFTSEEGESHTSNDATLTNRPLTTRRRNVEQREPSSSSIDSLNTSQLESEKEEVPLSSFERSQTEQSLSSIEKQIDDDNEDDNACFDSSQQVIRPSRVEMFQNSQQQQVQQIFSATKVLNIQETKFTPEQDEKDPQRYTFGCITPNGMTLGKPHGMFNNDPFLIENGVLGESPIETAQLRIPKAFDQHEAIMSSDESPISCLQNNGRTIRDLSPIDKQEMQNQQLFDSLENAIANYTRVQEVQPDIRVQDDFCDLSLKMADQVMLQEYQLRNATSHAPSGSVGRAPRAINDKDSCFSPIQHDNSLSRECVYTAVAVREAIQDHFNTVEDEYENITMVHYKEDQLHQQSTQHMFGNHEIVMTSNFPIMQQEQTNDYVSGGRLQSIEPQTFNLGYNNQSQSFSAFNSKHVLNQTPLVLNNKQFGIETGNDMYQHPNISASTQQIDPSCGKKKGGRKFLIKEGQLSILLQKALEQRNSQTTSHIQEQTISSDFNKNPTHSIFDSIIKQGGGNAQLHQSQLDNNNTSLKMMQTSHSQIESVNPVIIIQQSETQNSSQKVGSRIPKHKKKQKTQDFKAQGLSSNAKANAAHQSTSNLLLDVKRAPPKVPVTTIGQNPRKISRVPVTGGSAIQSQKYLQEQASRQPIMSGASKAGKNYHLSFNIVSGSNQPGSRKLLETNQDPEADRPLTLRNNYAQDEGPDQNIQMNPNLRMKAFNTSNMMLSSNFQNQKQNLTKEEMEHQLRSAICSSRYSSSSTGAHFGLQQLSVEQQTISKPSPQRAQRRKPNHYKNELLLTTETDFDNTTIHHHNHAQQLSIDAQTTVHKSKEMIKNFEHNMSGEGSIKRGKATTKGKNKVNSRDRVIKAKKKQSEKINSTKQQQMEFQTYLNLCNSISNDISLTKAQGVSTSLIAQTNSNKQLMRLNQQNNTSLLNDFASKGGALHYCSSTANHQNASTILQNAQHHYYHNTNNPHQTTINIQDTSSSNMLNNNQVTGATHTSGGQCEMSTTISNNQLSLTQIGGGLRGISSSGKGNQTISSGNAAVNNSSSVVVGGLGSSMNQTTVIAKQPKVIVPQLQLNKIKSSSTKRRNQLNGSHDEIQLQNLLFNFNQHLQANQQLMQTRGSVLKEGSNTVTPNGGAGNNISCSFQRGIAAAAAAAQQNVMNTKRSQASSLSVQRQAIAASGCPINRKDSIEPAVNSQRSNQNVFLKQLNQTVQTLKKKKEELQVPPPLHIQTAIQTAAQKERRRKSKDYQQPLTVMPQSTKNQAVEPQTKKVLQNSFTLKHLKLMTGAQASQQLTGRQIETQRATERTLSANRQPTDQSIRQTASSKEKKSTSNQQRLQKLVIKNQKHIIANTKVSTAQDSLAFQSVLNRSSINPKIPTQPILQQQKRIKPQTILDPCILQSNSTMNLSAVLAQKAEPRQFYDTKQQLQSPTQHKPLVMRANPTIQVPQHQPVHGVTTTTINSAKANQQFSLKSIFQVKSIKRLEHQRPPPESMQ